MATAEETITPRLSSGEESRALAKQWRGLTRLATLVAFLTSPALFLWLHEQQGISTHWALIDTFLAVIAFRGIVDLIMRRLIPWPSLFGTEEARLREEDVVGRRRAWFLHWWFRVARFFAIIITLVWVIRMARADTYVTWWGTATLVAHKLAEYAHNPQVLSYTVIIIPLFLINFLILFGPLLAMGITQMQAFEPGDAEWGVRLDDVRGQAVAVGGGVREGGRKARARPALPRRARNRKDDALEGDRDRVQLALPVDARVRFRADLHRNGRRDRPLDGPQGEEARPQVGWPVHHLHRRDRRRRPTAVGSCRPGRNGDSEGRRRAIRGALLLRPERLAHLQWRPCARDASLAGKALRAARAVPPADAPFADQRDRQPGRRHRNDGRTGKRRAQPAPRRDGRHRQPAVHAPVLHEPDQHVPRRDVHHPEEDRRHAAPDSAASAARRPDLLHRRDQRSARGARPSAHPSRPDGTPRLVPHSDATGPPGHLRPLHQEGRTRGRARYAGATGRAGADHERVRPRDDRAGLLDGADLRSPRGKGRVRLGRHRRSHDDDRVGDRDQPRLRAGGDPRGRDP